MCPQADIWSCGVDTVPPNTVRRWRAWVPRVIEALPCGFQTAQTSRVSDAHSGPPGVYSLPSRTAHPARIRKAQPERRIGAGLLVVSSGRHHKNRPRAPSGQITLNEALRSRAVEDWGALVVSDERMALELQGTLDRTNVSGIGEPHKGKVRDSYIADGVRTIITTDRQSAFDKIVGTIPFKGQTLNGIANFWFDRTADIVPNHLLGVPDPNVVRARECNLVPLEFVVRAYITGVTKTSLWFNYESGLREIAGIPLPDGLRKNERLAEPILTPATKLEEHDRNISRRDAVSEGVITTGLIDRIAGLSFDLFRRGTEVAAERGLILVDTKYEFGLLDGEVVLIDEIHTPDSSRFWYADTYEELFAAGKDQRALDKEPLREWFVTRGFRGDGDPPPIPDDVRIETASRYIALAEEITQQPFEPTATTAHERVNSLLAG